MTERPIPFRDWEVRATLKGTKRQVRRVIKLLNGGTPPTESETVSKQLSSMTDPEFNGAWTWWGGKPLAPITKPLFCPYGKPGDLLWVRETWAHYQTVNHVWRSEGRAFDEVSDGLAGYRADGHDSIEDFRAHVRLMSGCDLERVIINGDRWRPSIHMPRWASRITLRITDVRVERVQDISEDDARAEGCEARPFPGPWWQGYRDLGDGEMLHQQAIGETPPEWMIEPKKMPPTPWLDRSARDGFRSIWMGLHGPGAWDANPYVWVISFERVKP